MIQHPFELQKTPQQPEATIFPLQALSIMSLIRGKRKGEAFFSLLKTRTDFQKKNSPPTSFFSSFNIQTSLASCSHRWWWCDGVSKTPHHRFGVTGLFLRPFVSFTAPLFPSPPSDPVPFISFWCSNMFLPSSICSSSFESGLTSLLELKVWCCDGGFWVGFLRWFFLLCSDSSRVGLLASRWILPSGSI